MSTLIIYFIAIFALTLVLVVGNILPGENLAQEKPSHKKTSIPCIEE